MNAEQLVISFFERVYNQKDFDYVREIYAADYFEHTKTGARSSEDCRAIIMGACHVFPDMHVIVNEIVSKDEEIVATRLTFSATHSGEFFEIPATNRRIEFEAMEFFKIVDGLITESWGSWPIHDILEQLKR